MRQATAASAVAVSEQEFLHTQSSPLRTATGFALGTALSGVLWTVAGVLAWYLT
jgi:hypothetical protein